MFQSFEVASAPEQGPPRIAALRELMAREGWDGVIVPRADAHQGEYVADCDARLAWLTGFTGSAGFAIVLAGAAGLFVDGRYRVQARAQVDTSVITPLDWPETRPADWLAEALGSGGRVAYDPWLHTAAEIEALERGLEGTGIALVATTFNPVDAIWPDRPPRPSAPAEAYPAEIAGRTSGEKRALCAETLDKAGHAAAVLTLPDSIAWLLNIRGRDIPRVPIVQAFAVLHRDGTVDLASDPAKFDPLGPDPAIRLHPWDGFAPLLSGLEGPVRVDRESAPIAVSQALMAAGVEIAWAQDPCVLPKACKTGAEIEATAEAHLRDGAAVARFLHWLDGQAEAVLAGATVTEIDVVRALEGFRTETGALRDISFDTIAGAGPHGAIVHYRVDERSNRALRPGELMLVDSGGQYLDGTTDITRTVPIGAPPAEAVAAFTRVLQGMIALGTARFPVGLTGRDLDPLARAALWRAGQDYDHGTGHGVGVYLSVHEGPQRIARRSEVALAPGMIVSNEPGYYREGAFGIRIENLLVVREAPALDGGDDRPMLSFRTLTFAPIDRRLVDAAALAPFERAWLDAYHAEVRERLAPRLDGPALAWLEAATAPL